MGELMRIGDCMKSTFFTQETYEQKKAYWLERVDPKTEYVLFGKIYCAHCRTEKSVDMPEHFFYTKCQCKCEEKRILEEQKRKDRLERIKAYKRINEHALPAEVRDANFFGIVGSNSSEHYINVCSRCETFCRNFQAVKQSGRGIWLYGDFDTGKTYLAVAILKALQADGVLCTFTTMERIFEELKATYNSSSTTTEQGVMASYATVECLILDNFDGVKSSKKTSENWASDRFCEIITRRDEQHLPTVITSRSSIKELSIENLLPRKIVDKLFNKMVPFQLLEKQRRSKQEEIEF